jgi:hypothetical protein
MTRALFETRAELERQMDAARQLRSETLASASWICSALFLAVRVIRRIMLWINAYAPRRA